MVTSDSRGAVERAQKHVGQVANLRRVSNPPADARRMATLAKLALCLLALEVTAPSQTNFTYYFAHIAAADVWRTTFTYVNAPAQTVTCSTSFLSDSGSPLPLSFNGSSISSASDTIPAGGTARRQTDAQPNLPVLTGWAEAVCTGPVKASALFRLYNGTTRGGGVGDCDDRASQTVRYLCGPVHGRGVRQSLVYYRGDHVHGQRSDRSGDCQQERDAGGRVA